MYEIIGGMVFLKHGGMLDVRLNNTDTKNPYVVSLNFAVGITSMGDVILAKHSRPVTVIIYVDVALANILMFSILLCAFLL